MITTNTTRIKNNFYNYGFYLVYFIAGIILFEYYRYNLNVDGVSYITVAEKYLSGNFKDAINGSWGPLLSFLLLPLLALGINSLFALKLIVFLSGFGVLFVSKKYLDLFELELLVRNIALFTLSVITLYFAFWVVTPDILVVLFLLMYYLLLFSQSYKTNTNMGFLIGTIAGIGYLTKHYLFPFFLLHFFIFNILFFYRSKERKTILINFISALLIFITISGVWIYLLSNKYGYPTIGTSAVSGLALNNPDKSGTHIANLAKGLLPPVNETALSVWEDPSYLTFEKWSPFTSWDNFIHQSGITFSLSVELGMFFLFFAPFIILIFFVKPSITFKNKYFLYSLLSIALYSSGYLLTIVESRYIWINYILVFTASVYLMQQFLQSYNFSKTLKVLLLICFFIANAAFPVYALSTKFNNYKETHTISSKMENTFNFNGDFASDEKWTESIFVSYYTNNRYFGELFNKKVTDRSLAELSKYNISYLIFWNPENWKKLDNRYKVVYTDSVNELKIKIYDLKKRGNL